jgi:hypothetical protein
MESWNRACCACLAPNVCVLTLVSCVCSAKQNLLRELRIIDSVASLVKFALASEAYSLDRLTQISPMTRTLQLAYRLLTFLVKVGHWCQGLRGPWETLPSSLLPPPPHPHPHSPSLPSRA